MFFLFDSYQQNEEWCKVIDESIYETKNPAMSSALERKQTHGDTMAPRGAGWAG